MVNPIAGVNVLVAVGSCDGMAGASACVRVLNNLSVYLELTEAHRVDHIRIHEWPQNSKVGFIDLAVNNSEKKGGKQLTINFVNKIIRLGHQIIFIADEHGDENNSCHPWQEVLETCGQKFFDLTIKPQTRSVLYRSSCAILKKAMHSILDDHAIELLRAGDEADQLNFKTHFGKMFNNATKSNATDLYRRYYLTFYCAFFREPDDTIKYWLKEYESIEKESIACLTARQIITRDISMYEIVTHQFDTSLFFKEAYQYSSIVIIKKTNRLFIGSKNIDINLIKIFQHSGISVSGMPMKVTLSSDNEVAALQILISHFEKNKINNL